LRPNEANLGSNAPTRGDKMTSIETTFPQYLSEVCARTARALAAAGYDGLVVHSGSLLTVFEDDRTYPFEVHAPFKAADRDCAP